MIDHELDGLIEFHSPVRHVATEIERADGSALSVEALAETYRHPNTGDVSRIQAHVNGSDMDAMRWLIEQAIARLEVRGKAGIRQLVAENGGYRFADGISFDDLKYDRKGLVRVAARPELGEPYDPMSGGFSDNIRAKFAEGKSLEALRESMKTFGWVEEFPALLTDRGVVLDGHRRLKIAEEEGIKPVYRNVALGSGDETDRKRVRIAIAANVGRVDLGERDWKHIAKVLRSEGWTLQAIADTLDKAYITVQRVANETLSKTDNVDSLGRRRNQGRPHKLTDEQQQDIATKVLDEGQPITEAEAQVRGWAERKAKPSSSAMKAVDLERGRREGFDQGLAAPVKPSATGWEAPATAEPPTPDPSPSADHVCTCPHCGNQHRRES